MNTTEEPHRLGIPGCAYDSSPGQNLAGDASLTGRCAKDFRRTVSQPSQRPLPDSKMASFVPSRPDACSRLRPLKVGALLKHSSLRLWRRSAWALKATEWQHRLRSANNTAEYCEILESSCGINTNEVGDGDDYCQGCERCLFVLQDSSGAPPWKAHHCLVIVVDTLRFPL